MLLLPVALLAGIPPNPIHEAANFTSLVARTTNGVHYRVAAPDALPFSVLHLFGNARERGEAHGRLMSAQLIRFAGPEMEAFYREYVGSIDLNGMPAWLQAAIRLLLPTAEKAAPAIFELALGWLEGEQRKYNKASAANFYDEMGGIAHGACAAAADEACDEERLYRRVVHLNMLPDLIRMQCSMLGAYGSATADGHLVQLRALDFGGGPFANNSVLIVHHPASPEAAPPFAALSFPGFVGVVTGFSRSVALSEKVNDIHGGGTPPGSYKGQATSFVIRDMLDAASKEEAHAIAEKATRTWGVWLGVGDARSSSFLAIEYTRASANAYDAATLPKLTGQPKFADVAYIDKHPQPSDDPAMHDALAPMIGSVTARSVAQTLPRATGSGDVHIAVYDFNPDEPAVLVSLGRTNANGSYSGEGGRPAWAAPFVRFAMNTLWDEKKPSERS